MTDLDGYLVAGWLLISSLVIGWNLWSAPRPSKPSVKLRDEHVNARTG